MPSPPLDRRSVLVGLSAFASGLACSSMAARASTGGEDGSSGESGGEIEEKKPAMALGLVSPAIDDYAVAHSVGESAAMRAIAEETRATTKWWIMMVGPVEAALLRLLVRLTGAKQVLEIGTFTGYSAMAMAEGLPADGRITTCDISEEWTAIAKKHWATSPHGKKIRLELRPALETLKTLKGPFDLVFIDADKDAQIEYWETVLPLLGPGGLVVIDNVLSRGKVVDADPKEHVVAAFNEHVRADARMDSVMLPIRDGITVAWRK